MIDSANLYWFFEGESWSDEILCACEQFKKENIVYPNLMFASTKTYDYVNQRANQELENVFLEDENGFRYNANDFDDAEEEGYIPLAQLDFNNFILWLCLDESFPYMAFEVDFIEHPTFDGEELPDDSARAI